MPHPDELSDAELIARSAGDAEFFGHFYERHLPVVTRYLLARTRNREVAADLTAEVFAAALAARGRYDGAHATAVPWLLTIARRISIDSFRRGAVADEARVRLGMQQIALGDEDFLRVEELADHALSAAGLKNAMAELDDETRSLLLGRIVAERSYEELADDLSCSPQVVRKRVSRGLARVRAAMEERR